LLRRDTSLLAACQPKLAVEAAHASEGWWRRRESEHGEMIRKSLTINQFNELADILNNR